MGREAGVPLTGGKGIPPGGVGLASCSAESRAANFAAGVVLQATLTGAFARDNRTAERAWTAFSASRGLATTTRGSRAVGRGAGRQAIERRTRSASRGR